MITKWYLFLYRYKLKRSWSLLSMLLYAVCWPVVHPKLLGRNAKSNKIKKCCYPTIHCVLVIWSFHCRNKCFFWIIFPRFLHAEIFNQSNAMYPEKDAHQGQLNDPPCTYDATRQWKLRTTNSHFHVLFL